MIVLKWLAWLKCGIHLQSVLRYSRLKVDQSYLKPKLDSGLQVREDIQITLRKHIWSESYQGGMDLALSLANVLANIVTKLGNTELNYISDFKSTGNKFH